MIFTQDGWVKIICVEGADGGAEKVAKDGKSASASNSGSTGLVGWTDTRSETGEELIGMLLRSNPIGNGSGNKYSNSAQVYVKKRFGPGGEAYAAQLREGIVFAKAGQTERLRSLLDARRKIDPKKGSNLEVTDVDARGRTVLMYAAGHANAQTVDFLLKLPDLHSFLPIKDDTQKTVLHWVAKKQISLSGGRGQKVDAYAMITGGRPAMDQTTKTAFTTVLSVLCCVKGIEIDAVDFHGNTPLMYATMRNDAQQMRLLLEAGASANLRNKDGINAFEMAMYFNRKDTAEVLWKSMAWADATFVLDHCVNGPRLR